MDRPPVPPGAQESLDAGPTIGANALGPVREAVALSRDSGFAELSLAQQVRAYRATGQSGLVRKTNVPKALSVEQKGVVELVFKELDRQIDLADNDGRKTELLQYLDVVEGVMSGQLPFEQILTLGLEVQQ